MKWLLRNGANPHCTTYGTAGWFPEGHEGEAFRKLQGNCTTNQSTLQTMILSPPHFSSCVVPSTHCMKLMT
ncbi:hypothetical protein F5Y02DRAFT_365938 [Annulohypoxylon stygium]|nr:hypothetical protein F5Y02DRAFT_365938 [Annulohypoxylon stygium]